VEDINAPILQKSMTYSLKILVGERNPQFYETQYKATMPETAPEGFEWVLFDGLLAFIITVKFVLTQATFF
jgi:hypothetical protein